MSAMPDEAFGGSGDALSMDANKSLSTDVISKLDVMLSKLEEYDRKVKLLEHKIDAMNAAKTSHDDEEEKTMELVNMMDRRLTKFKEELVPKNSSTGTKQELKEDEKLEKLQWTMLKHRKLMKDWDPERELRGPSSNFLWWATTLKRKYSQFTEEQLLVILQGQLDGLAAIYFQEKDLGSGTWKSAMEALMEKFVPGYGESLRDQLENENVIQYEIVFRTYFMTEELLGSQFTENFKMQAFQSGLRTELQAAILPTKFSNVDEMAKAARLHEVALNMKKTGKRNAQVQEQQDEQEDSTKTKDETWGKFCAICGKKHKSRECSLRVLKGKKTPKGHCYLCNETSHTLEECEKRPYGQEKVCSGCGKTGHIRRECPGNPSKIPTH